MDIVKVGVIGCGAAGATLARQCNELETASVVAVCDVDQEATERLASELDARVYSRYASLLSSNLDAVVIATPNHLHAPMSIKAAKAGKHIFCETPMALKVSDCHKMIDAAQAAGIKLMVGQLMRLIGVYWKSHQIVSAGELGQPFAVSMQRVGFPGNFRGSWRMGQKETGGILFEVNVHELDYMRLILGQPESVYATMGHFTKAAVEYEDLAMVHLNFRDGKMAQLHTGTSASLPLRGMSIQCENGTLISNGSYVSYSVFNGAVRVIEPTQIQRENPFLEEIRSWIDAIQTGSPMVFDYTDGLMAIEMAEAAYKSAQTGRPVKLTGGRPTA